MAGPGAITACVLLAGRADGNWLELGILIGMIAFMFVLCYLVFLSAGTLEKIMGERGQNIFGRLLGVLLAALAVQYVADGILALKP